MQPDIKSLSETKLIGLNLKMSMAENKTAVLWKSFIPRRQEIKNAVGYDLYSMQIYPADYFKNFNPQTEFEKWASIEVIDFSLIPDGMGSIILPAGLYAVFNYKGLPAAASGFFQNIFANWLPNSDYILDNRPHFEKLGKLYKNDSPDSEEEIWIPIKNKS